MNPLVLILMVIMWALVAFVIARFVVNEVRERRISRHNRKVALDYLKKFQDARTGWRAATPDERARFQQSQRKKRSRYCFTISGVANLFRLAALLWLDPAHEQFVHRVEPKEKCL